ncbi:hypothetical protein H3C61_01685 [Candidatus Gracilibacteria bacterium]|nr:hypothetical protein [Candidatus Gracilibacteria bacterium]
MKKFLFLIFLNIFLLNFVNANNDFLIKKATSGEETYRNNLSGLSTNSIVDFQITSFGDNTNKTFLLNMPSGFEYISSNKSGNCNTNIETTSNGAFKYSFSGVLNCVSSVEFSYKIQNSGNYTISILDQNTLKENVKIEVIGTNTIIKAYSLDQNNNGFIDGYLVYFSNPISDLNDLGDIKVGGNSITSYAGNSNSGIINFVDNIFNSGELPQIISTTGSFGNVGIISNNSIIEEDKAKPSLKTTNTSLNIDGSDDLSFSFSENINTFTGYSFELKDKNNLNINYTSNFTNTGKTLIINPNTTLLSNKAPYSYSLKITDWSQNEYIKTGSININTNSCSIESVNNGSISSFPSCSITCNSGYAKSGNSCIPNSGGGSGGGGGGGGGGGSITPTCNTSTDLECKIYNGSYVWQLKSGKSCIGGELLKSCNIIENNSNSGSENNSNGSYTGSENGNSSGSGTNLILNLDEVKKYLNNNTNKALSKYIDSLYNSINYEYISYFTQINNNISNNYQELLRNYKNIFLSLNDYINSKSQDNLTKTKNYIKDFKTYFDKTNNPEKKYITKVKAGNTIIYKTNFESLKKPLDKIENVIFKKYKKLLLSNTISIKEYNIVIKNYNDFIFYLSVYRFDKTSLSKDLAKDLLKEIIKTYNKKR